MARNSDKTAILGDKELIATLESLKNKDKRRIMALSIRDGLEVIQKAAQVKATPGNVISSKASGTMRKAIQVKLFRNKTTKEMGGKVFVSRKVKSWEYDRAHIPGYVAHLVEFGHKVSRKVGGPVVGQAQPHSFLVSARDENKSRAFSAIHAKAKAEFEKVGAAWL